MPAVRRIDPTGKITTVAGGRPAGFSGDGGPATEARLHEPRSIAVLGSTLFIADSLNDRIRAVDLRNGVITTVAGTGASTYGGDGGPAAAAKVAEPRGVAVTPDGDVIVADTGNDRLRRIDLEAVPGGQSGGPQTNVGSQAASHPEAASATPAAQPAKVKGSPLPKAAPSAPAKRPAPAATSTSAPPPPSPTAPPSETAPISNHDLRVGQIGAGTWNYGMFLLSVPVLLV